ncbi:response regulator [Nitratireductor sp. CAU 1489]|uniref:Response regulator n=1 Tax=Nitratireductor arenosus TaxID=2682096 RepID=A0A844QFI5_9HYPH|nr:response regulator [Nitratireductor arenosus]MVA98045.1 response regulator [Nitratireductor arenosus]
MTLILIVEDNPINRDVLGRRLERRGYNIRFAEDGPAGVQAAGDVMPDVILMDIGLGEMDGWEATRRIKADPRTEAIPIIALTASAFESDRVKSLEAGCCDFDTKPVDLPRLLGKIEGSLQARARSRAADSAA